MFLRAARLLSLLALIGALSATPLTAFAQESAEEAAQEVLLYLENEGYIAPPGERVTTKS